MRREIGLGFINGGQFTQPFKAEIHTCGKLNGYIENSIVNFRCDGNATRNYSPLEFTIGASANNKAGFSTQICKCCSAPHCVCQKFVKQSFSFSGQQLFGGPSE
ncbi:MAG: hypothetical protein EOM03_12665 [Clostridia bacterium]|nr:hypothetical protein [Clostridia bacterium]